MDAGQARRFPLRGRARVWPAPVVRARRGRPCPVQSRRRRQSPGKSGARAAFGHFEFAPQEVLARTALEVFERAWTGDQFADRRCDEAEARSRGLRQLGERRGATGCASGVPASRASASARRSTIFTSSASTIVSVSAALRTRPPFSGPTAERTCLIQSAPGAPSLRISRSRARVIATYSTRAASAFS